MDAISTEQIRQYRLYAHHLDKWYGKEDAIKIAGSCGMQNTPPGAWENALSRRVAGISREYAIRLLENDKSLLQAWSFRGAPVVFPESDSGAFLASLVPENGEPWIYTQGIGLALDFLCIPFDELLAILTHVIQKLDGEVIVSKSALDQTLAGWMLPHIPHDKKGLWNAPSMYGAGQKQTGSAGACKLDGSAGKQYENTGRQDGNADRLDENAGKKDGNADSQTVGAAVVSFLLRPCACLGLVVFGKRDGASQSFTSYKNWTGRPMRVPDNPERLIARKYLHCYGPSTATGFAEWLGCSPAQAARIWHTIAGETEPVKVSGKTRYILAEDKKTLMSPPLPERKLHLLSGHDPYLGLQDRDTILDDMAKPRLIWQTVSNPGAVVADGAIIGMWKARKKGNILDFKITLWDSVPSCLADLSVLCEEHAAFHGLGVGSVVY